MFIGRDIIGIAQTGSGKTAAFVLPILHALWNKPQAFFACVLAPTRYPDLLYPFYLHYYINWIKTRELALQIKDNFEALGAPIGVKTACLIGGMDLVKQAIQLVKNPKPHIIIATPGRLHDHLENTKGFTLKNNIKYLVLRTF